MGNAMLERMEGGEADLGVTSRGHDFASIYREDGPGLWRTIYAFTGGRHAMTEDVVAEAFARAIAYDGRIRDPLGWLYRVSFRLAQQELKDDRRRGEQVEVGGAPPELHGLIEALRQLSPNQRAAIVLHHEADLPIDEVARRMGMAPPTVRVHIHRGRKRLRELLGTEEVTT
jgi:RNA polymerase sigma-70 factor (ECF subfamily)